LSPHGLWTCAVRERLKFQRKGGKKGGDLVSRFQSIATTRDNQDATILHRAVN
jgi:hypothetical protein